MMNRIKQLMTCLLLATVLLGCESLEDTYADFAGDGRIRYLAKCTDLTAVPGWESVRLSWTNGIDAGITGVLVEWSGLNQKGDFLLDKNTGSCVINGLEDATYEFKVYSVDEKGNRSIEAVTYQRPYTETHEIVSTFTKIIIKHFRINDDNLVLFFDTWNENMKEASLSYYEGSVQKTLVLDETLTSSKYYLLSGVNMDRPMLIHRLGLIPESDELEQEVELPFPDELLEPNFRTFNNDFSAAVRRQMKVDELTDEVIEAVTRLEFDYNISSMEDIMHFPNLQYIYLGKNRYQNETYRLDNASVVSDEDATVFALKVVSDLRGTTIERYNNHYLNASHSFVTEMGNPQLPSLSYIDPSDWTYEHNQADIGGHDSRIYHMLDNDPDTYWEPLSMPGTIRTHEVVFDMINPRTFNGFRVTQVYFTNQWSEVAYYRPNMINIHISDNGNDWENAPYDKDNELGMGSGETTLIFTAEEKRARYVKIIVYDMPYSTIRNNVVLAEFAVIR